MTRILSLGMGVIILAAAPAAAQDLARRVTGVADGAVQFHFAARGGVCGNGRNFMRVDDGSYYSTYSTGSSMGDGRDACVAGPVRVVIVRAGGETVKIDTYAGPLASEAADGRDLGAVGARDASAYFLGLAGSLDGRPAREALLPAVLADSATVTPALLALANDRNRGRDVRRSAISWLSRRRAEPGGAGADAVARTLDRLARDRDEAESVRAHVLSTVSGLDRGEGVPLLITYAGDTDQWLARQAFAIIARSGDPRARQFARASLTRPGLAEESRVAAIQGVAGEYATAADYKLLREVYPRLDTDRERDAVLSAIANAGGSENNAWMLAIAQSQTEPPQRRRRAVSLLGRSDDPRMKDALKGMIGER